MTVVGAGCGGYAGPFPVVGFVAAAVCTFLFYRMISGRLTGDAATTQVERKITVAARELPRGTRLRPEHLRTQAYQGAELPDGAFADPVAIAGRVERRRCR